MTRRGRDRTPGLALIVVVGILGVLSVLAVAFVMMAQLERRASQQRVNAERAFLLARSGIEDAMARLALGQDPDAPGNRYLGENWDGSADGQLSTFEAANEVYHVTGAGTPADIDACPLRHAMRPSLFVRSGTNPATVSVDGKLRGYSGLLRGDLAPLGNTYALRVSSGGFHVNGGDPSRPSDPTLTSDANTNLQRMLGVLAEAIDREDGVNDGIPVDRTDGENLVSLRPLTGWQSFEQIRTLALGGSQAKLEALRPYLTLHAWVDTAVIRPNARTVDDLGASILGQSFWSWADIKLARPRNPSDGSVRSPDFERVPVSPPGRIVGRAPVDLAWARTRRPALIALLADLKGLYLDDIRGTGSSTGTMTSAEIANTWIPSDDCHTAVSAILSSTSDLSTWQRFDAFCDTLWDPLPPGWTSQLRQARRDILKANFNPNSDLNKFGPNASMWKLVDKSDLLVHSTEFSLSSSNPEREVESVGRIVDAGGRLLALRSLKASLGPDAILRLSAQKDFVGTNAAGSARLPGDPDFLSMSQGAGKTWGHAIPSVGSAGVGLQTYPEPCVAAGPPGTPLSMTPAGYDGSLQLATVEVPSDDTYGNDTATTHLMMMLARFDDGFDLAPGTSGTGSRACVTDVSQVTTGELGHSLWDAAKPNTLYPDGAYAERGRVPAFLDRNNADGFHGTLSFWAKDNYSYDVLTTVRLTFRAVLNRTNYGPSTGGDQIFTIYSQNWFLGGLQYYWAQLSFLPWHLPPFRHPNFLGGDYTQVNPPVTPPLIGHTWHLYTAAWETRSLRGSWAGSLRINNDTTPTSPITLTAASNDWLGPENLTLSDSSGAHRTLVGGLGQWSDRAVSSVIASADTSNYSMAADATIDEFIIYDFGGAWVNFTPPPPVQYAAPANAMDAAGNVAANRWQEGRYYRESTYYAPGAHGIGEAGSWTSVPLGIPAGSVLRRVAWTFRRPASLPDDYAEVELLSAASMEYLWKKADGVTPDPDQSRSTRAPGWTPPPHDPQRWDVGRPVPGDFRLRVVFERGTPLGSGIPILDSPVFDDLALIYTPAGGSRVLAWSDGEK